MCNSIKDLIDRHMAAVEKIIKEQTEERCRKNVLETVRLLKEYYPQNSEYIGNLLKEFDGKYSTSFSGHKTNIFQKSKETKDLLYHYTSVETLYKIFHNIEKNLIKLRANLFMKMNDPFDCQYLIKEVSQFFSEKNMHISEDEIEKNIEKSMNEVGIPYVISLTKLEDSLPMWNMYGQKGHGVAIGFSKEDLQQAVSNFQNYGGDKIRREHKNCFCRLYECKYWNKKEIIKKFIEPNDLSIDNNGNVIGLSNNENVCAISYLIKHPSYKHEKESRVVFMDIASKLHGKQQAHDQEAYVVSVDDSKLKIFNYQELLIPLTAIKEIVCGPCTNKEFVQKIIPESLHINVKQSKIPYTDSPKEIFF